MWNILQPKLNLLFNQNHFKTPLKIICRQETSIQMYVSLNSRTLAIPENPESLVFLDESMEQDWDYTLIPHKDRCTEMVLSNRKIERLDLSLFPQLETLWLNNNKFKTINFLQRSFRLRRLYMENNSIRTIENLSKWCKYLEILLLQNNKIRDLKSVLENLKGLLFLQELNLFGNPVQEETDYRISIIYYVPSLKILDRHAVSDEERLFAKQKFEGIQRDKICFGKRAPEKVKQPKVGLSRIEQDLGEYVLKVKTETQKLHEAHEARMKEKAEQEAMQRMVLKPPPIPKALDFLSKRNSELRPRSASDVFDTSAQHMHGEKSLLDSQPSKSRTSFTYQSVNIRPKSSSSYLTQSNRSSPSDIYSQSSDDYRRSAATPARVRIDPHMMSTYSASQWAKAPTELETKIFLL